MSDKKFETVKTVGYSVAALTTVLNIVLWIYCLWFNSEFLSSSTYLKIVFTSFAVVVLALIVAGFSSFMHDEAKLKKDKLIN